MRNFQGFHLGFPIAKLFVSFCSVRASDACADISGRGEAGLVCISDTFVFELLLCKAETSVF